MSAAEPVDGSPHVTTATVFTGVHAEPLWPGKPPMARLRSLMKELFSFTSGAVGKSAFNWDDRKVVGPPGDQGELAACISYAAGLAAATTYRIKTGKLLSIAPRVMHLCTMGLPPGNGTNSRDFEDAALASGLPYTLVAAATEQAAKMAEQAQCAPFSALPRLKVVAVHRHKSADEVREALRTTGPVVVHMKLFDDFWSHYIGGTIYSPPAGASSTVSHAVCLIGYDDAKQCWIGVNSRGPNWGSQGGRFMLKYGACGVMAPGAAAYSLSIQA